MRNSLSPVEENFWLGMLARIGNNPWRMCDYFIFQALKQEPGSICNADLVPDMSVPGGPRRPYMFELSIVHSFPLRYNFHKSTPTIH